MRRRQGKTGRVEGDRGPTLWKSKWKHTGDGRGGGAAQSPAGRTTSRLPHCSRQPPAGPAHNSPLHTAITVVT